MSPPPGFIIIDFDEGLYALLALFLLCVFSVWIFSERDLFLVLGTDASCVLYIICFQFINLRKLRFILSYYTWFIALLASHYAVFFPLCLCLIFAEFDSSVYITIQFWLQ